MERATYERLACLQGLVIPDYYDEVQCEGTLALVLSDIGGACVATQEGAVLSEHDMRLLLSQALHALGSQGIMHNDLKLDNFHLVDSGKQKAIMAVDLERSGELPEKDWKRLVQHDVNHVMRMYKSHLDCLEHDGLLLPKMDPFSPQVE